MGRHGSHLVCRLLENGGALNDHIPYRDPSDRASLIRAFLWLVLAAVLCILALAIE